MKLLLIQYLLQIFIYNHLGFLLYIYFLQTVVFHSAVRLNKSIFFSLNTFIRLTVVEDIPSLNTMAFAMGTWSNFSLEQNNHYLAGFTKDLGWVFAGFPLFKHSTRCCLQFAVQYIKDLFLWNSIVPIFKTP